MVLTATLWRSFKVRQNIPLSSCEIIYLLGRRYNGVRSTKRRLRLNIWNLKKHGASGIGSKKSPDQSITGFKMIFSHQNLGMDTSYVQISVISVEIWHKIKILLIAGHFVSVYPFLTILSKVPTYILLFYHQNPGLDTSYVQISLIMADIWYKI